MKHLRLKALALAGALVSGHALCADTLISERQIGVDAAIVVAQAALAACRAHGSIVTITILDRADRVVLSLRDNGASPHSVEHSLRKAHTALTYNMSSREYGKNAAGNPGSAGTLHLANITTAAGGLPIRAGDTLVIWKLDRLGRSIHGLIALAADLSERGIDFRSLTDGFDTSTASGRLLFHILASVAEMERALKTSGREPVLLAWLAHAKAVNGEKAAAARLVGFARVRAGQEVLDVGLADVVLIEPWMRAGDGLLAVSEVLARYSLRI